MAIPIEIGRFLGRSQRSGVPAVGWTFAGTASLGVPDSIRGRVQRHPLFSTPQAVMLLSGLPVPDLTNLGIDIDSSPAQVPSRREVPRPDKGRPAL